jgi:uracil-DNA glycosylase
MAAPVPNDSAFLREVRACTLCAQHLPSGTRPILQLHPSARILIASQAPGRKAHESGIPFNDASGDRLRRWLGVSTEQFYNPTLFAIVPMGLCYPGKGSSGDLPPRQECATRWRSPILQTLTRLQLTLVIGQYAASYHLAEERLGLTKAVQNWRQYWPTILPMPHPSPTNNIWLARNKWFEQDVVPLLRNQVAEIMVMP